MTKFSNIPWISDGKLPGWVQDDDLMQFARSSFAAKHWPLDIAGIRYFFPTDHPYSICAEYNAKHPDSPQMVPWNPKPGEEVDAPEDRHRSNVLRRDGHLMRMPPLIVRWEHCNTLYDIVGYVPKASTSSLAGEPETARSASHNFSAGGEHSPVAGASGLTGYDPDAEWVAKVEDELAKMRVSTASSSYNPETHAIFDKSTHGVYDLKTYCAVRKMTESESRGVQHTGGFSAWARESGIVIPDPDPIDTAAANNNIPPDALRAALKELGK